jgi:hypothetical protein
MWKEEANFKTIPRHSLGKPMKTGKKMQSVQSVTRPKFETDIYGIKGRHVTA